MSTKNPHNMYRFYKIKYKQNDTPQTYPKIAHKGQDIGCTLPMKWDKIF